MLDYKLLEALTAVYEEGGFEKAAQHLGLTQSAVSQRIRQLEEWIGQILLIRSTPPRLTDAGRELFAHFKQVELLEKDLLLHPVQSAGQEYATIRMAINNDSLATWFTDSVAPILTEQKILFEIEVDDQDQTQNLLRDGAVFCSISTYDHPINGCTCTKLGQMSYGMYCAPGKVTLWFPEGYTKTAAATVPAVRFNRKDNLNNAFYRDCFGEEQPGGPTFFVPSSEQCVNWIARGFGYGALPLCQSTELVQQGLLVDLRPDKKIDVSLFLHRWNIKSDALDLITDTLVKAARSRIF